MPKPAPTAPHRPEDSPVAWFSELLIAIDREEFRRATHARRELFRLGWSVIQRRRTRPEGGAE